VAKGVPLEISECVQYFTHVNGKSGFITLQYLHMNRSALFHTSRRVNHLLLCIYICTLPVLERGLTDLHLQFPVSDVS
jgi:hypothetical protein